MSVSAYTDKELAEQRRTEAERRRAALSQEEKQDQRAYTIGFLWFAFLIGAGIVTLVLAIIGR